jgi:serine/threonine-protein phosphatase 2A regulatory subunit B''
LYFRVRQEARTRFL